MGNKRRSAAGGRTSRPRGSPFRILHEWDGRSHKLSYAVGGRVLAGVKWPEHQPGIPAWKSAVLGCHELAHQITQANARLDGQKEAAQ